MRSDLRTGFNYWLSHPSDLWHAVSPCLLVPLCAQYFTSVSFSYLSNEDNNGTTLMGFEIIK